MSDKRSVRLICKRCRATVEFAGKVAVHVQPVGHVAVPRRIANSKATTVQVFNYAPDGKCLPL